VRGCRGCCWRCRRSHGGGMVPQDVPLVLCSLVGGRVGRSSGRVGLSGLGGPGPGSCHVPDVLRISPGGRGCCSRTPGRCEEPWFSLEDRGVSDRAQPTSNGECARWCVDTPQRGRPSLPDWLSSVRMDVPTRKPEGRNIATTITMRTGSSGHTANLGRDEPRISLRLTPINTASAVAVEARDSNNLAACIRHAGVPFGSRGSVRSSIPNLRYRGRSESTKAQPRSRSLSPKSHHWNARVLRNSSSRRPSCQNGGISERKRSVLIRGSRSGDRSETLPTRYTPKARKATLRLSS